MVMFGQIGHLQKYSIRNLILLQSRSIIELYINPRQNSEMFHVWKCFSFRTSQKSNSEKIGLQNEDIYGTVGGHLRRWDFLNLEKKYGHLAKKWMICNPLSERVRFLRSLAWSFYNSTNGHKMMTELFVHSFWITKLS